MCQILDHTPGAPLVPLSVFTELATRNPDGIGLAYVTRKSPTITTYRTLRNVREAFNRYRNAAEAGHRVIVHWRFTTHGASTEDNCHPFPLPGGAVLFHNGMLPIEPVRADKSDTRTLALDCMRAGLDPFDSNVARRHAARRILTAVSDGSRLIALAPDGNVWRCGKWVDDPDNKRSWANAGVSLAPISARAPSYYSRGWNAWEDDEDARYYVPSPSRRIPATIGAPPTLYHYPDTKANLYAFSEDALPEYFMALCDACAEDFRAGKAVSDAEAHAYAATWRDATYPTPRCEACYRDGSDT